MNWEPTWAKENIENLVARAQKYFSKREEAFIASILSQVSHIKPVSYAQERWLNVIAAKYSEQSIQLEREWSKKWTDDHRTEAIRVAEYYNANPPYYSEIVSKVISSPKTFKLTKFEWTKFCENKYSLRIRSQFQEDLRFKVSDLVQIRSTNKIDLANAASRTSGYSTPNRRARKREAHRMGFVLETDAMPLTRVAKGSRIYKILLIGDTCPIFAHESDLKRGKQCRQK